MKHALKTFLLVSCAVVLMTAGHAHAASVQPSARFKNDCERQLPPASVTVTAYPSDVVYNFSLGIQDLTRKAGTKAGNHTLGLTVAALKLDTNVSGAPLQDTMTRMLCAKPTVDIALRVGPQTVYVAKEFPQTGGSSDCMFWEIAEHELRHVRANQAQAEKVAAELQDNLRKELGTNVYYGTEAELKEMVKDLVNGRWAQWAKQRYDQVQAAHEQIDSPAEYARVSSMCGGAGAAAVRKLQGYPQ